VPAGQNPPPGAVIDYWLGADAQGPVSIAILDAQGAVVRSFASDMAEPVLKTGQYFADSWLAPAARLSSAAGAHRFVWDLRYPRPPALSYDYSIAANTSLGGDLLPQGPLVLPGRYQVELTVAGKTWREPLTVTEDPRVPLRTAGAGLKQQLAFTLEVEKALKESYEDYQLLQKMCDEIVKLKARLDPAKDAELMQAADATATKAELLQHKAAGGKNLAALNAQFAGLVTALGDGDRAPPAQYRAVFDLYAGYLRDVKLDEAGLWKQEYARMQKLIDGHDKQQGSGAVH
jgi:hypothetical protein